MKIVVPFLFAALTLALGCPALAITPHSPVLIERDAAQAQTVGAGEDFFIALPSNVTTGYAWTSSLGDGKILAYQGNVYEPPNSTLAGTQGQQIFIFHAARSGTTAVTFAYARSFEPGAAPAKSLTFNVTVR